MRTTALALATLALVWGENAGAGAPPDDHRITVPARLEVAVGGTGSISLTIAGRPGYTVSRDAPVTVDLSVDKKGLSLPRTRYTRDHAADARAADPRFDLLVRADAAGEYAVAARLSFWMCGARTCRPVTAERVIAVVVPAPEPPADAGPGPSSPAPSP